MPCCDDRADYHQEAQELRTWLNQATRAACDMRTVLRQHGLEALLCKETVAWIAMHDKQDAERIARETEQKLRKQAKLRGLRKLSLEERRALGL